jgi:hypothetical protein
MSLAEGLIYRVVTVTAFVTVGFSFDDGRE